MASLARFTLALVLSAFASPAVARPVLPAHGAGTARPLQLRVQLGRQAGNAPAPAFKLAPAAARKGPVPAPTPEYNPLKRRHIAMPALDPETDLAF
jgi:hypothetical protein